MPPAPDTRSCSAHLPAVLHLSSAAGGGADRYVRDLARDSARRHYLWHTGAGLDVIEDLAARRFFPLAETTSHAAGDALARFARSARLGLLHLHAVDAASRARITRLVSLTGLPFVATLHDLGFLDERAFDADGMPAPDRGWTRAVTAVLGAAATVIAPSEFIAATARAQLPGVSRWSSRRASRWPSRRASAERRGVAGGVQGARSRLRGRRHRRDRPAQGQRTARTAGGRAGRLQRRHRRHRLHRRAANAGMEHPGAAVDPRRLRAAMLPAWLAAYRVRAVLFPNRLPESFSYTLSEAWAAGVPVIVPQDGALGERVARHGGGFVLPTGFAAGDAARLLLRLFSAAGVDERLRVQSQLQRPDPDRVPTLEAMNRAVDLLYARFAAPAPAAPGTPEAADTAAATEPHRPPTRPPRLRRCLPPISTASRSGPS